MDGRDRLRELLDAVLDDEHRTLGQMADGAHVSAYHFTRQLSSAAGEPPVAMKRRVLLERAAWQLRCGSTVTQAALDAGYESVEGFSRAFGRAYGHPPSTVTTSTNTTSTSTTSTSTTSTSTTSTSTTSKGRERSSTWLPAPNGIHFHPPTSLWVHTGEQPMNPLTDQLLQHDLDDTRALLEQAGRLDEAAYRHEHLPGTTVLAWNGEEASVAAVLERLVLTKEVWVASIEGEDLPPRGADDVAGLFARHEVAGTRWLAAVRDIDRRGAWADRLVDALCDPPESFVLSSVVAHVLTFSAHRRQLARLLMRAGGLEVDHGDPIEWLRDRAAHGADTTGGAR